MSQNNIIQTNRVDFMTDAGAVLHSLYLSAGALCLDGSPIDTGGTTPAEITLADGHLLVGQSTGKAGDVALSGEATIINSGAITLSNAAVIGKVLTGYTAGAGTVAATDSILAAIQKVDGNSSNATVIARLLTGYTKGAGTVAATDSLLAAIQKLDGNDDAKLASASFTDAAVTAKTLTGISLGTPGDVSAADTILAAIAKLAANDASETIIRRQNVTDASLPAALAFYNALQTTLNAHAADGAEHFKSGAASPDIVNFPVAGTATTLANLKTQCKLLADAYAAHNVDAAAATPTYHNAQDTTHALASVTTPTTLAECFTMLLDIQTKYNLHDAESTAHTVGSQHQSASVLHTYTATATDQIVQLTVLDAGFAIVIPTSLLVVGRTITVKDSAAGATANDITISTQGSEKIDGSDTKVIDADYGSVTLFSDGLNWFTM